MTLSTSLLDSRDTQLKKLWTQALIFREFWKNNSDTCTFEFSPNAEGEIALWLGSMKMEYWELLSS